MERFGGARDSLEATLSEGLLSARRGTPGGEEDEGRRSGRVQVREARKGHCWHPSPPSVRACSGSQEECGYPHSPARPHAHTPSVQDTLVLVLMPEMVAICVGREAVAPACNEGEGETDIAAAPIISESAGGMGGG